MADSSPAVKRAEAVGKKSKEAWMIEDLMAELRATRKVSAGLLKSAVYKDRNRVYDSLLKRYKEWGGK